MIRFLRTLANEIREFSKPYFPGLDVFEEIERIANDHYFTPRFFIDEVAIAVEEFWRSREADPKL